MTTWSAPLIATRTGAAHLRRGQSCQDASGSLVLEGSGGGSDGGPVWAMVVADGHGGARYRRSRDGSRIACEVALDLVATHFGSGKGSDRTTESDPEALGHFLQEVLAEAIVGRWQERIQRHWQENPDAAGEAFTPFLYGTTLALVVLTPRWWAHTGLGDWDLVRVEANGSARLLSEEGEVGSGGEATTSLCLADAALRFHSRTEVHWLAANEPPFSLQLSTDGIRKSCTTDADFLNLARHFVHAAYASPEELPHDLDRISSQGSGDDVSVAISRWGGLREGSGSPALRRRGNQPQSQIKQPEPIEEWGREPVESPAGVDAKPRARARQSHKPSFFQQPIWIWIIATSLIGHVALAWLAWKAVPRLIDLSQGAKYPPLPASPAPSGGSSNTQEGASLEQFQLLCSEKFISHKGIDLNQKKSLAETRPSVPGNSRPQRDQPLKRRTEKTDDNHNKVSMEALVSWNYDPVTGSFSEASLLQPALSMKLCDALQDALRSTLLKQEQAATPPGEPAQPPQALEAPPVRGNATQR